MNKTLSPEELAKRKSFAALVTSYAAIASFGLLFFWGKSWFLERKIRTIEPAATAVSETVPTPTASPAMKRTECLTDEKTIYADEKRFALCGDDEGLKVAKKDLTNSGEFYYVLSQATGKIATELGVYVSYADDATTVLEAKQGNAGSRVFRIAEKPTTELEVLVEPEDIPNKEDFVSGSLFRPQFVLPTSQDKWSWSPEGTILLLQAKTCLDCQESGFLYGYDLESRSLTLVGKPQAEGQSLRVEWTGPRTLTWYPEPDDDDADTEGDADAAQPQVITFRRLPSPTPPRGQ